MSTAAIARLEFDGLEIPEENILLDDGDGLKCTQIRLGPARLTHCMRWLGFAKRCMEIAQDYVDGREGFGVKLADRESVQIKLGEVAHQIQIGRLLTMHAAWKLDQGSRARKEVSMAKVQVADTLHNAADVAIQLNGARGYSKDTILRMDLPLRALGAARRWRVRGAQDGAGALHARGRPRFLEVGSGRGPAQYPKKWATSPLRFAMGRIPTRRSPALQIWCACRMQPAIPFRRFPVPLPR